MDFFDLHQELRINQHRKDIDDAERAVRDSKNELETLRAKLDRLHLASTALWEFVSERLGITEEEFLARVQEVDLRDGRLDGRIREHVNTPPTSCRDCGRPNNARRRGCLYCGAELPPVSPL